MRKDSILDEDLKAAFDPSVRRSVGPPGTDRALLRACEVIGQCQ